MSGFLPWLLLFFLIFFAGIFFLVLFSLRTQDRALAVITSRQDAMREEMERLADALDTLLTESEVEDEVLASAPWKRAKASAATAPAATPAAASDAGDAVPGLERLLLGGTPESSGQRETSASRASGNLSDTKGTKSGMGAGEATTAPSGLPDLHL